MFICFNSFVHKNNFKFYLKTSYIKSNCFFNFEYLSYISVCVFLMLYLDQKLYIKVVPIA